MGWRTTAWLQRDLMDEGADAFHPVSCPKWASSQWHHGLGEKKGVGQEPSSHGQMAPILHPCCCCTEVSFLGALSSSNQCSLQPKQSCWAGSKLCFASAASLLSALGGIWPLCPTADKQRQRDRGRDVTLHDKKKKREEE